MGWRRDEVWLQADIRWFSEPSSAPAVAVAFPGPAGLVPAGVPGLSLPSGLEASRRRRAARSRRQRARRARAAALVIGSTAVIPLAAVNRPGSGASAARPLPDDPPSLTVRPGSEGVDVVEAPVPDRLAVTLSGARRTIPSPAEDTFPAIEWNRASARGLPFSGRLVGGTQLPVEGPDWVTWNPVRDRVPNAPRRLYGHERTIRAIVSVITAHRSAHPRAARVVVGDISFRDGGPMDQHVSHQNGLDVDVYYPRRDRVSRAPVRSVQVDRALAQDLLDRFVAAGAHKVFVGYSTGLRGPRDVVVPYPNHEDHMHVRFPAPPG